jgi:hypothetical protein
MANYFAAARSSYFKVKDPKAFKAWAVSRSLDAWGESEYADPKVFAIASADPDGAGWPSSVYNEEKDDFEEINFMAELATHLADRQVAILMEAGAEKLRYVNGCAIAVHANGKTAMVSLGDTYSLAKEAFGDDI